MNLIERFTKLFKRKQEDNTFTPMNRRQRRAAGIRTPVGLLPEGVEAPQETQVPRYVMRHGDALTATLQTRRVRRERARITHLIKARGLA